MNNNEIADPGPAAAPESDPAIHEQRLRAAIEIANVPSLLMLTFQVTGDERWLQPPYVPTRGRGLGDHDDGGLPPETQQTIRQAALDAVLRLERGEQPAVQAPDAELTLRMMSVCMGEAIDPKFGPMLATELARRISPDDPMLAPRVVSAPRGFKVVVIGAGVAGIAAAQQLEEMGIDYTILEKASAAGGVWMQNTYPGAGVDTPSHLYSFYFAKNDWSRHFELRDDLQRYFARVIDQVVPAERIRYDSEVLSAHYDARTRRWILAVRRADGEVTNQECNVLLTAVGSLNRPRLPELPGIDTYAGESFHSADWPADLDVSGKRVTIVGTGASSMQISPAIADQVQSLTIIQRSPQWVAPFEKFMRPISPELRDLLATCPIYYGWYWLRLFWQFGDKVIDALRVDPDWPHPERSVNARNDAHREFFTRYLRGELVGREDLLDMVVPNYPPFGKRILLDNGWYATLKRDNVRLIDQSVTSVEPQGVVVSSGELIESDIVIWATGFDVARFVSSLDIRGLNGTTLRKAWDDDDPRAYLGVSVPEFPNLFMLGGPNSFPGSGSFMFFMEVQMRYIRRLLTEMFERGIKAMDASPSATSTYNDLVVSTHNRTVWTHPGMTTYYRNRHGRVVFVMPFLNVEYWEMTGRADIENYVRR